MSLIDSNTIIQTITRYRKNYVNKGILPDLFCVNSNDGTHQPLTVLCPDGDRVYLYCYTCDYQKEAGLVTADAIQRAMDYADIELS